jgi:CMP-N-acetylneuraminic acid synthetase
MTSPNIIALIPARAGSKRVQHKNIRRLGGHPLLAYTISAALDSGIFARVIVSTNTDEIAAIARYYGAEVPFLRPSEYATDTSPDIEWLTYTLEQLGQSYDCFSLLRPTSPFRQAHTIQRAWREFLAAGAVDSLRAVEKVTQHPGKMWVLQGRRMSPLLLSPLGVPWHSTPYQALPPVYAQNASLEIAWTRVVLQERSIAGQELVPFITDEFEGFDINNEMDWLLAEALLQQQRVTLPAVAQPPYPLNSH